VDRVTAPVVSAEVFILPLTVRAVRAHGIGEVSGAPRARHRRGLGRD